ncbi:MAG TPA: hypothetical protein VMC62_12275 [Longilinea sp.]|nr:hypothetical protein [Longilinea sp.]
MNRKLIPVAVLFIALTTLACGLSSVSNLVGGNASSVSSMWSDVPVMNGLSKSDLNLPLEAKVLIQGYIAAASQGQGNIDFIAYTTGQTSADVTDYYTVDRMTQAGWAGSDQPGCTSYDMGTSTSDSSSNTNGALCFFAKDEGNNKGALLAILATPDSDKAGQTDVFFARIEVNNIQSTP